MWVLIHLKKDLYITLLFLIIFVISKEYIEKEKELNYFMNLVSRIFLIIFYQIEKYLSKSNNKNKRNSSNMEKIELFPSIKKIRISKNEDITFKLFSLISCYIISYLINQIVEKKYELKYDSYMYIKIIFLHFFNVISGQQIYIHHKISIIIDLIIIIIFIRLYIEDYIKKYIYIPYMLYSNYCYALYLSLIKYINTHYFVSVFLLETIQGIFLSIYYLISKYDDLKVIYSYQIYYLILYFFYSLMYHYFFLKLLKNLTLFIPF